ncbi:hypothetical protein EJ05DRAFT_477725 [Pseudovirgaria hyperparasitica]|uniref:Heterokaryon incompatibility domain-containing protein n=1 Tax=Pseudovirgaria hyperparasitica TaxID=470096 RepID=A0A6A6W223_9PEZI|nr:uncharacterized protein EJ05DRAFT_477725 [Pseudovirgaria hyperparasitica]KAF2756613.1 hypothetical protein EJ05DRAFT_477725 [Pseudovirgaria hyperparasitica]
MGDNPTRQAQWNDSTLATSATLSEPRHASLGNDSSLTRLYEEQEDASSGAELTNDEYWDCKHLPQQDHLRRHMSIQLKEPGPRLAETKSIARRNIDSNVEILKDLEEEEREITETVVEVIPKTKVPYNEELEIYYEPLENAQMWTRLLEVLPGKSGDPLRGFLTNHCINDIGAFDAVSYQWSRSESVYLPCSGKGGPQTHWEQPISPTSFKALRDIRREDFPVRIWMDSICINQADEIEKRDQLQLMEQIYTSATRVRAWLDIEIDDTAPCFRRLKVWTQTWRLDKHPKYLTKLTRDMLKYEMRVDLGDDPTFWSPIEKIMSHDYWERLWVQQEIVFAKSLMLHCKSKEISGQSLIVLQTVFVVKRGLMTSTESKPFYKQWYGPFRAIAYSPIPAKSIAVVRNMRAMPDPIEDNRWRKIQPGSLLYHLQNCRPLAVTKPKDRVLGLLGIAKDYNPNDINVDPSWSTAQVFASALSFFVEKRCSLAFLGFALRVKNHVIELCENEVLGKKFDKKRPHDNEHRDHEVQDDRKAGHKPLDNAFPQQFYRKAMIPSWIPNWDTVNLDMSFLPELYTASGELLPLPSPVSIEKLTLSIRGYRLAHVDLACSFLSANPSLRIDILDVLLRESSGGVLRTGVYRQWRETLAYAINKAHRTDDLTELALATPPNFGLENYEGSLCAALTALFDFLRNYPDKSDNIDMIERVHHAVESGYLTDHDKESQFIFAALADHAMFDDGTLIITSGTTEYRQLLGLTHQVYVKGSQQTAGNGDEIWIVFGCPMPMILRPHRTGFYEVIAPVYVAGVMDGEAVIGLDPNSSRHTWNGREYEIETVTLWDSSMLG